MWITFNIVNVKKKGIKMAKRTVRLATETEFIIRQMGMRIKNARLRRNITAKTLAGQAGISEGTLSSIENGASTVSIGALVTVLKELGLEEDFNLIALDKDEKERFQWRLPRQRVRMKNE